MLSSSCGITSQQFMHLSNNYYTCLEHKATLNKGKKHSNFFYIVILGSNKMRNLY